ncbi:MAG: pyridoxal phosphate-dependent aminotransferase [Saprospiraceae bacterium]
MRGLSNPIHTFALVFNTITMQIKDIVVNPSALLSDRIKSMDESATIKMAQKARDLAQKGINVISLSLGEPDFDTPNFIKEAAKVALDEGFTKYTPVPGLLKLRQAISSKFKRDNNLNYEPTQIVVSNGAKQSIANVVLSLINPGDEVIIITPYWVSYAEIVKLTGGIPVYVGADISQDYKISATQLDEAISEKTKLIIFSSPCNPTGSVYEKEELEALAAVILNYDNLMVISDEIYEYINFTSSHFSIAEVPGMEERTATINGFSKGFSMTGWRLGYMGAPQWLASACSKVQGQFTSGANSFGQEAAITALDSPLTETYAMRDAFKERRDMLLKLLSDIPGFKVNKPMGAFYVFPDISAYFGKSFQGFEINNSDDFSEYILSHAHVGLVSGSAFGDDNCIRISYAASEPELREAVRRIKEALL